MSTLNTNLSLFVSVDSLPMTGERFIPGMPGTIEVEHMHRYALAIPLAKGKCVLDVASGEGYGSHLLAASAESVIGVDISLEAIEHAKLRYSAGNLEYRQGSCTALPLVDNSVDLVVSFETIEHHDQHQEMLDEIARVLRPNGLLLISSPNKKTYSDIPGTNNQFHVKELYLNEFMSLLNQNFSHIAVYGQRAAMSSVIVPLLAENNAFRQFQKREGLVDTRGSLDPAIYFVALAGRSAPLPALGMSIYNSLLIDGCPVDVQDQSAFRVTKMYWVGDRDDLTDRFGEHQVVAVRYPENRQPHQIQLVFPKTVGRVGRIRLDVAEAMCVTDIQTIQLIGPDQSVIWQWSGDLRFFILRGQIALIGNDDGRQVGCTAVAMGNDPQFELDLPPDIFNQIRANCALILTVVPYELIDRLPALMYELARLTAQPESVALIHKAVVPLAELARPKLADDLQEVAALLTQSLASRNLTIAQQRQQIVHIRDELVRTEAQLHLLKNVLLSNGGHHSNAVL